MHIARFLVRILLFVLYRFRTVNAEVLKTSGPVILLPNHISWLDWLFYWAVLDDTWMFVSSRSRAANSFVFAAILDNKRTFALDPIAPYALKEVVRYLQSGGKLLIFPEGHISRSGSLRKLFDGVAFLASKSNAKVITSYLSGAIRLPWVRHEGWTQWFPTIQAHFDAPREIPAAQPGLKLSEARGRLTTWIRDHMLEQQLRVETEYGPQTIMESIRLEGSHNKKKIVVEDVQGNMLSHQKMGIGAHILSVRFSSLFPPGSEPIGMILPNVAATPVVLFALWTIGRVPAILNYAAGSAQMMQCAKLANLKVVLTSRAFVEKANLDLSPLEKTSIKIIYLEDVRSGVSPLLKIRVALGHLLFPAFCDPTRKPPVQPDSPAVVLFTSGSEGIPKGVELTHGSILANVRQAAYISDFVHGDRFFNALPMFHSFGLVLGTMLPLNNGNYVYLYPTPLHYRVIPAVVYDRNCTVMVATNTFLYGYARRSHPFDFQSIRRVFAGGEKLQEVTFDLWCRKFGVRIFEGYGTTEFSPLITGHSAVEPRSGTTGRFLPGVRARVEPVEGVPEGGRLFIKGPQMMRGYLNADENAKFKALGGWYDTGDIVKIDDEGYVHILGRAKRFAKIGGEMVSLTAVEEALSNGADHLGPRRDFAVLSRRDKEKGEVLLLVTNNAEVELPEIWRILREAGMGNLSFPKELKRVDAIPVLATGKTDYRSLNAQLEIS